MTARFKFDLTGVDDKQLNPLYIYKSPMAKIDHFKMVSKAIEYIEDNLTEPISVLDICRTAPVSTWQFQRLFRAYVGDSVGSYLRGRRLSHAADLLVLSENRILDVAVMLQFGSQEAFTRAFKSQYKMTPGQIRENSTAMKIYKKPRLTEDMLKHIQDGIQRAPTICNLGPLSLVGMKTTITSYLGENPDFEQKIPPFWMEFDQLKRKFSMDMDAFNYGVAISTSENMFEEELTYFAAVPSPADGVIPSGMLSLTIKQQLYAVFENQGLADKSQATIDYIYGIWLPESGYQRAKGYDFEIFDHRYSLKNPLSISRYCLPIEPGSYP